MAVEVTDGGIVAAEGEQWKLCDREQLNNTRFSLLFSLTALTTEESQSWGKYTAMVNAKHHAAPGQGFQQISPNSTAGKCKSAQPG